MTVAECLSHILPHIMAFLAISDEGKIRIFTFHNTYSLPYLIGNIKSIDSISQTEFYNEIKLHYGWDGATNEYSQCYIYPTSDTTNPAYALSAKKRTIDIYCPAIYFDTAQAIPLAKRYYSVWNQGITEIKLVAYIDNIDIQIGNKIQVDLGTDIGEIELTVIKAQKIIGSKNEIRLTGILQTDEYGDAL
jgi:hypothetical protein